MNGIDVPSSIVCVGGLAGLWKPKTMADITPERYGVSALSTVVDVHWSCHCARSTVQSSSDQRPSSRMLPLLTSASMLLQPGHI